jgi:transcription-repair coupling factor (superfamily II helicase)
MSWPRRIARMSDRRVIDFGLEVQALAPGDLVVHADHGIGRFVGLKTVTAAGATASWPVVKPASRPQTATPMSWPRRIARMSDRRVIQAAPGRDPGGAGARPRRPRGPCRPRHRPLRRPQDHVLGPLGLALGPHQPVAEDVALGDHRELAGGEALVVHADHGIGRFVGLKTVTAAGAPHDCLEIQYSGP